MDHTLITDVAICIVVAWVLAVIAQLLRQPLIIAYLVAGFLVGPAGVGLVEEKETIETISSLGLLLLLFMIGLEIDLGRILGAGRLIGVTAVIQVLGCTIAVWFCFLLVGLPFGASGLDGLYLAFAGALSSTVIIVKILYERRDLYTLAGRLTLGVLVLQDLFAILFLAIQPNLRNPAVVPVVLSVAGVIFLVAAAFTISRNFLPPLFKTVARLPELVLVGALAWCFVIAGLASVLGLSREMGALVAGVAISTFPYTTDVTAKVTSLRDFFVTLFFVSLGMAIPEPSFRLLGWATVFAVVIVVSRFITAFPTLHLMRQGHRVGFLVSLNLSQLSEFSVVILALGLKAGHIAKSTFDTAAYTFVLLAGVSAYSIARSDGLFRRVGPWLVKMGLPDLDNRPDQGQKPEHTPPVYILGFSWTASSMVEEITRSTPDLLSKLAVVDFNPQVGLRLRERGILVIYGDITHRETLVHAGVPDACVLVCTLPNTVLRGSTNLRLLQMLREINPAARIFVNAELLSDVPLLYAAGASYVSVPRLLEAGQLSAAIQAALHGRLDQMRADLDASLADRKEIIP